MILLVDEAKRSMAEKYLQEPNPYACRILSGLRAYGTAEHFSEQWLQLFEGKPKAAISRLNGNITVFCREADEELREFIEAIGYNSVLADKDIFPRYWQGEIVVLCERHSKLQSAPEIDFSPPIRDIYPILLSCKGENLETPPFEEFYPDMSHRMRHGLARALALRVDGRAVACCMTSAETESCAIISGVACLPEYRRRGYAGELVSRLTEALSPLKVFAFCRPSLVGLYSAH